MFAPASPVSPLVQSPVFFENIMIPDEFGLVCWNIHKENFKPGFNRIMREWETRYGLDLILLQEALFSGDLLTIAGFPYVAAANLQLQDRFSGVATAAHADPHKSRSYMTLAKEPLVFTPKNTLVTLYRFKDKSPLMVINVHAINFRSLAWYQWELSRLNDLLRGYRGPMILAGDFNCWQPSRKLALDRFTAALNLRFASPSGGGHVKKWFGFHLDRIYFRGLTLHTCFSVACKTFSDHNPVMARFIKQAGS